MFEIRVKRRDIILPQNLNGSFFLVFVDMPLINVIKKQEDVKFSTQ